MLELMKSKWSEILEQIKTDYTVNDISFKTWLKPLEIYSVDNNRITILVNDEQFGSLGIGIVRKKFYFPIKATLQEFFDDEYEIDFILPSDINNKKIDIPKVNVQLEKIKSDSNLNPRYTFDNFIVGPNNNFAYSSSLAVAEAPGEMYNPLFLYGGAGLGKTHLMQSIAHFILENNPDTKVLYVTSEQFTNELIEKIGTRKDSKDYAASEFREKYRNLDVLLIDDIQFIIGKERTQLEFFNTFNTLVNQNKQVIISSDKPPKDFDTLEERLRTRFDMGLTVDIKAADYETRMAILKLKSNLLQVNFDDDIFNFLAENVKSNIRELEGALNRLVAFSRIQNKGQKVSLNMAENLLKDYIYQSEHRNITIDLITQIVAEHFEITKEDLISNKRSNNIAYPRQICMYLCKTLTDASYTDIAAYLGNRNHTTIIYGVQKIDKQIKDKDEYIINNIDVLTKKISPQ